mmetsp:Transcript_22298/g.61671  ORF Transcript_22298/g.61671 Transcript_22298/m.61671 type:complete len:207 (-) Transcript_22298:1970-2590(-)
MPVRLMLGDEPHLLAGGLVVLTNVAIQAVDERLVGFAVVCAHALAQRQLQRFAAADVQRVAVLNGHPVRALHAPHIVHQVVGYVPLELVGGGLFAGHRGGRACSRAAVVLDEEVGHVTVGKQHHTGRASSQHIQHSVLRHARCNRAKRALPRCHDLLLLHAVLHGCCHVHACAANAVLHGRAGRAHAAQHLALDALLAKAQQADAL